MSDPAAPSPESPKPPHPCELVDEANAPLPKSGWLRRWPSVTFLLPFCIYIFFTSLVETRIETKEQAYAPGGSMGQPHPDDDLPPGEMTEQQAKEREERHSRMPYSSYAIVYTAKIALTTLAMLAVIPGYLAFPLKLNPIALVVGIGGGALWIVLAKLQVATYDKLPGIVEKALEMGGRAGFNPLVELHDSPAWARVFLAIRFFGLVLVVPVIEEFFLRGFLMRYVIDIDWPLIPFGVVNRLALATVLIFPVLWHPERLAAAAWFSLVTWMMLRTRNIWDCVVAHALTNLVLGLWVLYSGDWWMM
jgi:CAAX prenyl protease-like protein